MSKHTPGPWEARKCGEFGGWGIIAVDPMRGRVDSQISGMKQGDAFLIAAAPELMEALKLAQEELESAKISADNGYPQGPALDLLLTVKWAIAKAEGPGE